jgi:endoglucanase
MIKLNLCVLTITLLLSITLFGQDKLSEDIRLNQIGFYPKEQKVAVVVKDVKGEFYVTSPDQKQKYFAGQLSAVRQSEFSSKKTCLADFSAFTSPGTYTLVVPGVGYSYNFEIKANVLQPVAASTLKSFYFIRASASLPEKFAGKWSRPLGHPDNKVMIHSSAATSLRPEGTIIASSKGWYDAGDYNKYIVNSGITMGTLLSAYEDFPDYFRKFNTDIPESSNNVPDILDEVLWNLRWMLTMQDPADGGVYHKLTNASFDGMIMPHEATKQRYVVQKGTAATLDFAAVTAQASRIFKEYEKDLPGLADSCLSASKKAWQWSIKNPGLIYDQDAMNKKNKPEIATGAYGDKNFADEFFWAAAELYVTTKDDQYYKSINITNEKVNLPSWGNVKLLGYYSIIRNQRDLTPLSAKDIALIQSQVIALSDYLASGYEQRSFLTIMGKSASDYGWGSSSVAANQGMALIYAYKITGDKKYFDYALSNVDYLLGRNGTGYSYVTGMGDKTPMHPHHRPSEADGIQDPIPGLLSGGPNPQQQDKCSYPSSVPDESFVDDVCSYASNEIAINWNAPIVYLVNAVEALESAKLIEK